MAIFPTKADARTTVIRAFVFICIPIFLVLLVSITSLNTHIEQMMNAASSGQHNAGDAHQVDEPIPLLHGIVRPIRRLADDGEIFSPGIEYLLDHRAVLIILGVITVGLTMLFLWALGRRVYRPFMEISNAISGLTDGNLAQPIEITGGPLVTNISQQMEKLRRRLSEGEKHQIQFMRHVSHEIKTPLTSIKEGSRLLADEVLGPITEEQREITDILNKSTTELQGSIENLLNYNSAISIEKIKQRATVDLVELIQNAVNKQTLALKTKQLELLMDTSSCRAFVDSAQITAVFENLLSNAIKFSPIGGKIKLTLKKPRGLIRFTIQDDGPGVELKQREAIFGAFFVGSQTHQGPLKGTGLGLSIARQYIEMHQGTIKVVDNPQSDQSGACFEVTLKD